MRPRGDSPVVSCRTCGPWQTVGPEWCGRGVVACALAGPRQAGLRVCWSRQCQPSIEHPTNRRVGQTRPLNRFFDREKVRHKGGGEWCLPRYSCDTPPPSTFGNVSENLSSRFSDAIPTAYRKAIGRGLFVLRDSLWEQSCRGNRLLCPTILSTAPSRMTCSGHLVENPGSRKTSSHDKHFVKLDKPKCRPHRVRQRPNHRDSFGRP
jgi:hypothetical protein